MIFYIVSIYFGIITFLLQPGLFNSFDLSRFNIFKKFINKYQTIDSIKTSIKMISNDFENQIFNKYLFFPNDFVCNTNTQTSQTSDNYLSSENNLLNYTNSNKKLIIITPGGLKGFYVLGICSYIKENYNISDYVFSGASAGSWNSLFLSYKHDPKK